MQKYIEQQIKEIKEKVGNRKVLLALSGGVDSSVCAALLSKAIPGQLVCVFVDHGFMRKNEGDQIQEVFSKMDLEFVRANCQDRFVNKVKGVTDTEQKRKIIGAEFIKVFEEYSEKFNDIECLAQGTIYPDVIESGKDNNANIKSHHNVGGLPEDIRFNTLVEPLRALYKDQVREVGRLLGLPDFLVDRQPFPGPGLAVRVIGEITHEKLDVLREAGAEVLGIVSIFTYGMQKGLDRLAAANVKNISLTNFDTIAEVAAEEGYIKPEDIQRLIAFRNNPSDESWINK